MLKECFGTVSECKETNCFLYSYCESYVLSEQVGRCPEFGKGFSKDSPVCSACKVYDLSLWEECGKLFTSSSSVTDKSKKYELGSIRAWVLEQLKQGVWSDEFKIKHKQMFGREESLSFYVDEFKRYKNLNFEKRKEGRRVYYKLVD